MDNDRNDPQNDKGIYYLRTMAKVTVNDAARPSVTQIVNDAVDLCRQETNGSEYDMALWLHDWTLDQLEYDHSLNWCSAESGLTRHQGTCESYQPIYSKLLDAAGIANGRITGNGHTWNAAKIDSKWCQMDLTWDDTSDNWYGDLDQRHLYFGLTDELMAIAHSDHTANYQKDDYAYRSTDLSNNFFVRDGKADEWAEKYADRIQQHLDAREESFSIDADNQSFPPSISGIQNGIVAYAMNQRQWSTTDGTVTLTTASNVTRVSSYEWSAKFDFEVEYPAPAPIADVSQADIAVADVKYTGVAMEPTATVDLNGIALKQGIDYIATYSDNVTPGTAEVAIYGIGNYTGTIRKTFEIRASDVMTEFVSGLYAGGTNRRADADGFAYWLFVTKELGYVRTITRVHLHRTWRGLPLAAPCRPLDRSFRACLANCGRRAAFPADAGRPSFEDVLPGIVSARRVAADFRDAGRSGRTRPRGYQTLPLGIAHNGRAGQAMRSPTKAKRKENKLVAPYK